ncbi:hypothetical protein ES702_05034 [subsurface metagenome]
MRFGIYNTNYQVIKDIKEFLNLGLKIRTIKDRNDKWKKLYRLDTDTIDQCKSVATLIEPYLRIKKEHAQIFMKFKRSDPRLRGMGQSGDNAANYRNQKLRERIMALNKQGPEINQSDEDLKLEPDKQMRLWKGGDK